MYFQNPLVAGEGVNYLLGKIMLLKNHVKKKKKNDEKVMKRFLIIIKVSGSTGPLRIVVKKQELVSGVIHSALKAYARQKRLPFLGFDTNHFLLYSSNHPHFQALSPREAIGSYGARNFMLFKKQQQKDYSSEPSNSPNLQIGHNWKWKPCFN